MPETRVLISCRQVWGAADLVEERLHRAGIEVDMPRFEGQQLEEEDLLPIIGHYDGVLAGDDRLTRLVLEAAPRLRVISRWGIGLDAVDLAAASELGIRVTNTPGVFGNELADYAMGYIHMLARRQHEVDRRVRQGEWHKVRGVSLAGKTLGIIGLGSSGRELAKRAAASSMMVLGYDVVEVDEIQGCQLVALSDLLASSDIVSLHIPATPETRHLINRSSLSQMKRGVWLINISRGSLVDEGALVDALDDAHVGGAALDVFETEPVPTDSRLLEFENVIFGSHNGSNTEEAVERTTWMAVDNLINGLAEVSR